MFRPADIPRTQHVDTDPLTYNTRVICKRNKAGKLSAGKPYLYFRIAAALGKRAGFSKGDAIRVEIDTHTRQGRLLRVEKSSRHLSQGGTSQWAFTLVVPHTGDMLAHFPAAPKVSALVVLDTSVSDGLIFELPVPNS